MSPQKIKFNRKLRYIPVYIPWSVEDFYWEHVKAGRDKKCIKFANPSFGAFSEPLTVVDSKGRIVLWYLPGLLSLEHQVGVYIGCSCRKPNELKTVWGSESYHQYQTIVKDVHQRRDI